MNGGIILERFWKIGRVLYITVAGEERNVELSVQQHVFSRKVDVPRLSDNVGLR